MYLVNSDGGIWHTVTGQLWFIKIQRLDLIIISLQLNHM